jgi:hypothetical protein
VSPLDAVGVLETATRELRAMHNHYHSKCSGGCPTFLAYRHGEALLGERALTLAEFQMYGWSPWFRRMEGIFFQMHRYAWFSRIYQE